MVFIYTTCATSDEAKRLGGKATLRADWEQVKVEVMRVGVFVLNLLGEELFFHLLHR